MMVARLAAAMLYYTPLFCIAELATIIPTAGGGYAFAGHAFSPFAGFMTRIAMNLQYTTEVFAVSRAGCQLAVLIPFSLVPYLFVFASHIRLRAAQPRLERPYWTPIGAATAWLGLALTVVAFVADFPAATTWSGADMLVLALIAIYFLSYARSRVLVHVPEGEFALARSPELAVGSV
jgi:amino acid transporter